jgi:NADH-quinone oxidoreductase subunit J
MIVETIILIILSVLAVASAIVTIAHKQPLKSAMALVFHFFMLAGIYLTLSAQFLAIMQIMVYAGAIMVLVLFVIMLLNANDEEEAKKRRNRIKQSFAVVVAGGMLVLIVSYIAFASANTNSILPEVAAKNGSVQMVGTELYTNYLVPLEIVGILLLSAIIGAVMMAKKKL